MLAAEAAAKELPQISLGDALELTVLIARKDLERILAEDSGYEGVREQLAALT